MSILKAKVVGLSFNKFTSPVKQSECLILRAYLDNKFDSDAIAVFNSDSQLVGYIANSKHTLSINNIKNGNLSASQLKSELNFDNQEYYAKAERVYSSCIYLKINSKNWKYINKTVDDIETLESQIVELKSMVSELLKEVKSLKLSFGGK